MKNDNIIKKITINIGDTEAEVTPEQAKALFDALGQLLGESKPIQVTERHVHHDYPYRWPYWTWTGQTLTGGTLSPHYDKWTVTYNAQSNTALLSV